MNFFVPPLSRTQVICWDLKAWCPNSDSISHLHFASLTSKSHSSLTSNRIEALVVRPKSASLPNRWKYSPPTQSSLTPNRRAIVARPETATILEKKLPHRIYSEEGTHSILPPIAKLLIRRRIYLSFHKENMLLLQSLRMFMFKFLPLNS